MDHGNGPPGYFSWSGDSPSTPVYSHVLGSSERVLQSGSGACSSIPRICGLDNPHDQFIYRTTHLEVNLGPRVWGLRHPAYGHGGTVRGTVKFSGQRQHVEKVTIKLEGSITTLTTKRGVLDGQRKVSVISLLSVLYHSSSGDSTPWDAPREFSLLLPSVTEIDGKPAQLPPSFSTFLPGCSCQVEYILKIDMVRKAFRRHESAHIQILYLPKSRPLQPPLASIPPELIPGLYLPLDDRVQNVKLAETWPSGHADTLSLGSNDVVCLSLPSPKHFTSGETIPCRISLIFRSTPQLAKLFSANIRLELLKRIRIWHYLKFNISVRDIILSKMKEGEIREPTEGVILIDCGLQAGTAGHEYSWQVEEVVEVQHIVRAIFTPPENVSSHLPRFRCEIPVQIATDHRGSLERELVATGGVPTPALALLSHPPPVCDPSTG